MQTFIEQATFAAMNDAACADAFKAILNAEIAARTDPDEIASLQMCREYFTNQKFRDAAAAIVLAEIQEAA